MRLRRFVQLRMMGGGGGAAWTPDKPLTGGAMPALWMNPDVGVYKDAAKTQPASADGDDVNTIADQSGNGKDMVLFYLATAGKLYTVGAHRYIRTFGLGGYVASGLAAGAAKTIFVVAKKNANADASYDACISMATSASFGSRSTDGLPNNAYRYNADSTNTVVSFGGDVTALSIISLVYSGPDSASIRINGGAETVFNPRDNYAASTSLAFASQLGWGSDFAGDFGPILLYTSALPEADVSVVNAYLSRWSGVPLP